MSPDNPWLAFGFTIARDDVPTPPGFYTEEPTPMDAVLVAQLPALMDAYRYVALCHTAPNLAHG